MVFLTQADVTFQSKQIIQKIDLTKIYKKKKKQKKKLITEMYHQSEI
jgi:hypothetical protein